MEVSSESSEDEALITSRSRKRRQEDLEAEGGARTSSPHEKNGQGLASQETRERKKKKKKDKKKEEKNRTKELNDKAIPQLKQKSTEKSKPAGKASQDSKEGRNWTVSIAIPGSVVSNAQTRELKTYLAGQIARAAAVFSVDEIIVYDDKLTQASSSHGDRKSDPNVFLARLLQYLETPQYLRKLLFPVHPDLKYAGLLNPLDTPPHMRMDEWSEYREGVVLDKKPHKKTNTSYVTVGLRRDVVIDKLLLPGTRLTVRLQKDQRDGQFLKGTAVSPDEPRERNGVYWGYSTRLADSIKQVWEDCPYEVFSGPLPLALQTTQNEAMKGGYDYMIGTSERGDCTPYDDSFRIPAFRHLLIIFGGPAGIEECVDADESVAIPGERSRELFNMWVNTCPNQGSRTIRSEEAILISMSALRRHIWKNS